MIGPMDAPSGTETKLILPSSRAVKLWYRLAGGTFIKVNDEMDFTDVWEDLEEHAFPTGEGAKAAKMQAAKEGSVIVQRSIVTTIGKTAGTLRFLLSLRDAHDITTGKSILTSGNPNLSAPEVFAQKVHLNPPPVENSFHRIGVGLSEANGIYYLFDVHHLSLADAPEITRVEGADPVLWATVEKVRTALKGKPMELDLLNKR